MSPFKCVIAFLFSKWWSRHTLSSASPLQGTWVREQPPLERNGKCESQSLEETSADFLKKRKWIHQEPQTRVASGATSVWRTLRLVCTSRPAGASAVSPAEQTRWRKAWAPKPSSRLPVTTDLQRYYALPLGEDADDRAPAGEQPGQRELRAGSPQPAVRGSLSAPPGPVLLAESTRSPPRRAGTFR